MPKRCYNCISNVSNLKKHYKKLIMVNMLRGEAESYCKLGKVETAEKLYKAIVERVPKNSWGYIGWGNLYCYPDVFKIKPDYDRAEKIYKIRLAYCDTDTEGWKTLRK